MSITSETPIEAAPYRDPSLPVAERVADLLGRMTIEEKVAQLASRQAYELGDESGLFEERARTLLHLGVGQVTRIAGGTNLAPEDVVRVTNEIQRFLVEHTRLGIPAIVHEECTAGYMALGATVFPQSIALAATFDPDLATRMGTVIRGQMRRAGAHQALAPVLDVCRDPRWGRVEETFGEDPYLVASMGTALLGGIQGEGGPDGIVATVKHFAGHGVPEGGMNSAPPHMGVRELREIFLAPFEAAIRHGGARSVMHAYHEIDGVPCIASRELLTGVLRDEWGFEGTLVSDYNGIEELVDSHAIAPDLEEAAAIALAAGVDVELPTASGYAEPLVSAVERGLVAIDLVDTAVSRVLAEKFLVGLFDDPFTPGAGPLVAGGDGAAARAIAEASVVLLENDGVLPLAETATVAVIGPNADLGRHLIGDYSHQAQIELLVEFRDKKDVFGFAVPPELEVLDEPLPSILDGIRKRSEGTVIHERGCDVTGDDRDGIGPAVAAAEQADVAVLVVGEKSGLTQDCTCGESRDRVDLGLLGVQQELLEAVVATGTPIVVLVVSGRPLAIPWAAEHAAAVVQVFLPGEAGGDAVAGVLFGDVNPGGKLPITVPRHVGQVPIYYGHRPSGGRSRWNDTYVDESNRPLWPFGFGRSYTTFEVSDLEVSTTGRDVTVEVAVTNGGDRSGDEVVQVYAARRHGSVTRPVKELVGFRRVRVEPGEKVGVEFALDVTQFAALDRDLERVVEPGEVEILVGTSSDDLPLRQCLHVEAVRLGREAPAFFSTSTISTRSPADV